MWFGLYPAGPVLAPVIPCLPIVSSAVARRDYFYLSVVCCIQNVAAKSKRAGVEQRILLAAQAN